MHLAEFKSKHVESVTGDFESCHNEISALTMSVNGGDFALGLCGDLHTPMAHANHHHDSVQNHTHLHKLFVQQSFNNAYCATDCEIICYRKPVISLDEYELIWIHPNVEEKDPDLSIILIAPILSE